MDENTNGKSLGIGIQSAYQSQSLQDPFIPKRRASVFEEVQLSQEELLKVSMEDEESEDLLKTGHSCSDTEFLAKSSVDLVPARVEMVPIFSAGPSSASTTRPQTPDFDPHFQSANNLHNLYAASLQHSSFQGAAVQDQTSAKTSASNVYAPAFSFDSPNKSTNQLPWQTDILLSGAAARSSASSSTNVTANPSPAYSRSNCATLSSTHHHTITGLLDPMATETISSITQREALESSLRSAVDFEPETIASVTFRDSYEKGNRLYIIPEGSDHTSFDPSSTSLHHHHQNGLISMQQSPNAPPPPLAPPTAIGIELHGGAANNSGHSSGTRSPSALLHSGLLGGTGADEHSSHFLPPSSYPHHSASSVFNPFGGANPTLTVNTTHPADQQQQPHQHYYSSSAPSDLNFFSFAHSSASLDSRKPSSTSVQLPTSYSAAPLLLPGASAASVESSHHDQCMEVAEVRISDLENLDHPIAAPSSEELKDFSMTQASHGRSSLTADFNFNRVGDEDIMLSDHTYNVAVAAAFQYGQSFNQQHSASTAAPSASEFMRSAPPSERFGTGSMALYKKADSDSASLFHPLPEEEEAAMSSFVSGSAGRYDGLFTGDQLPLNMHTLHHEPFDNANDEDLLLHADELPLMPKKKKSRGKKSQSLAAIDVVNKLNENGSPVKKRVQVKTACAHCRKSSKKCSEHRPCDRCIHNNLECVDIARVSKSRKDEAGSNDISWSGSKPPTAPKRKKSKASTNPPAVKVPEDSEGIMEWISTAVESIAPAPKKRGRKKKTPESAYTAETHHQDEEPHLHSHIRGGDCDDQFTKPFHDHDHDHHHHPFSSYSQSSDYGLSAPSLYNRHLSSSFPDNMGFHNFTINNGFPDTVPSSHQFSEDRRRASFAYPTAHVSSHEQHPHHVPSYHASAVGRATEHDAFL